MNLEHDLRRTFRRKPAPPDLADRVLARLEPRDVVPSATRPASPRGSAVRWLAAAAIALVVTGGGLYYRHQQTVAETERVQQEVRLALRIAGDTLALVQRKLQEPHR